MKDLFGNEIDEALEYEKSCRAEHEMDDLLFGTTEPEDGSMPRIADNPDQLPLL